MNLIDVGKEFATEEACLAYLEELRWPQGVRCPQCGGNKISRIERRKSGKNKRQLLYQCLEQTCHWQFSATAGTIFHDSHLPLSKWFLAVALVLNAKKGLSAKQMERDLGVSYRTAWYLCHRIRKAMEEGELPKFTGVIEVDETYVGGKYDRRRKRGPWEKTPVMGIIERQGRVEAYSIPTPSKTVLVGKIKDRVSPEAELV
jgi:transposase-like protein